MSSSEAPAGSSPAIRPSAMTRMRSLIPISSGSSEEISSTASPSRASSRTSVWMAALAPTSTPRVGSSNSSTRGRAASHLAMTTFCWLPPDRKRTSWPVPREVSRTRSSSSARARASGGRSRAGTALVTSRTLSRTDWRSASPSALRSSLTSAIPARIACRGRRGRSRLPPTVISPAVNGSAPNRARARALRPEPWSPPTPRISPARRDRVMSASLPFPARDAVSTVSPASPATARGG